MMKSVVFSQPLESPIEISKFKHFRRSAFEIIPVILDSWNTSQSGSPGKHIPINATGRREMLPTPLEVNGLKKHERGRWMALE